MAIGASFKASSLSVFRLTFLQCQASSLVLQTRVASPSSWHRSCSQPLGPQASKTTKPAVWAERELRRFPRLVGAVWKRDSWDPGSKKQHMELNLPRLIAKMGALELGSKFIVESPLAWGFVPVARPVRDDRLVSRYISRPDPHATDLHGFFTIKRRNLGLDWKRGSRSRDGRLAAWDDGEQRTLRWSASECTPSGGIVTPWGRNSRPRQMGSFVGSVLTCVPPWLNGYGTARCGATFAECGIGSPADGSGQIVTIGCTGAGLAREIKWKVHGPGPVNRAVRRR